MKKVVYCLVLLLSFIIITNKVYAVELNIYSDNVLLYNLNDDEILYEKNSEEKTSIASLTKIITAITVLENINNINEKVIIKDEDLKGLIEENAATAGYKVGDETTYEELLYALLLPSGADAANALARNVAGSTDNFVELMNEFATEHNLENTHFANPIGLDDDRNYSTLKDLAKVFKYALKNKTFKKIVTTKEYTSKINNLKFTSTIQKTILNSKLSMDYLKGGKTGTTGDAGLCLASIASYKGIDYMLITTNAPYAYPYNYHILDAKTIYEYFINNYSYKNIVSKNDKLVTIKTKYANPKSITITSDKTIKKYLSNDYNPDNITLEYNGIKEITPLNKKGDKLGTVNIIYNDKILETVDIKLDRFVTIDLISYFKDNKLKCIIIILIITICIHKLMKFNTKKKKRKRRKKRK